MRHHNRAEIQFVERILGNVGGHSGPDVDGDIVGGAEYRQPNERALGFVARTARCRRAKVESAKATFGMFVVIA